MGPKLRVGSRHPRKKRPSTKKRRPPQLKKGGFRWVPTKPSPAKKRRRRENRTAIELCRTPDVFLCHSSKDKRFVRTLARDLDRVGVDGWLDEWELEAGDPLHLCIGRALSQCRYVAVVLSPALVKSAWCMEELGAALNREKEERQKVVIPLLCKRAEAPALLGDRLYLDLSNQYFESVAQLSGIVHRLSKRKLRELLVKRKPKTIPQVADILSECGWDGGRLFDEQDYEEFRQEMERRGYHVSRNTFEFPDGFEKIAQKLMHLRVVRDIYGPD
ncbi:MAG: toll/interleukin-1 receptor domain-containing protein [Planctomycetota bacterium]